MQNRLQHFCNFLREFCANVRKFSGVRGAPPPDPLLGRTPYLEPPRNFFLLTPLLKKDLQRFLPKIMNRLKNLSENIKFWGIFMVGIGKVCFLPSSPSLHMKIIQSRSELALQHLKFEEILALVLFQRAVIILECFWRG